MSASLFLIATLFSNLFLESSFWLSGIFFSLVLTSFIGFLIFEKEVPPLIDKQQEGLYKQLRVQFDEKSKTLNEARKELFASETKRMALEKKIESLQNETDPIPFLGELKGLSFEVEELKKEISHLEELVSHILSR